MGQWSDVYTITTRDSMQFELSQNSVRKSKEMILLGDQPGFVSGSYGYQFGEYIWGLVLKPITEHAQIQIGVLNKRFKDSHKMYGATIGLNSKASETLVKVYLDANKKVLAVYSP